MSGEMTFEKEIILVDFKGNFPSVSTSNLPLKRFSVQDIA